MLEAEHSYSSVEEYEGLLRTEEWAQVALTMPSDQGPIETDFRLLVCPSCGATVPPPTDQFDFLERHIVDHVATLTRIVIASAGVSVGVSLGVSAT